MHLSSNLRHQQGRAMFPFTHAVCKVWWTAGESVFSVNRNFARPWWWRRRMSETRRTEVYELKYNQVHKVGIYQLTVTVVSSTLAVSFMYGCTHKLPNSVKPHTSWWTNSWSASQEIPQSLWNPMVHYHFNWRNVTNKCTVFVFLFLKCIYSLHRHVSAIL